MSNFERKLPEADVPALREALRRGETTVEDVARAYRCSVDLVRHRTGFYKGKRWPPLLDPAAAQLDRGLYDPWKRHDADYKPNGEGPSEHPRRDKPLNRKMRKCLGGCDQMFMSSFEGNRICERCARLI